MCDKIKYNSHFLLVFISRLKQKLNISYKEVYCFCRYISGGFGTYDNLCGCKEVLVYSKQQKLNKRTHKSVYIIFFLK